MNTAHFHGGTDCESVLRHLDGYTMNDLPAETHGQVREHLKVCPACSAELEARTQLRARLKDAVMRQSVPPELPASIRQHLDKRESCG
jgi:anti-sigma factor (TIGR02949 family)